jgi:biopolymer transport protein ExbD
MALSLTGTNRTVIADINVTPMADVMIVLLIRFMRPTTWVQDVAGSVATFEATRHASSSRA